MLFDIFRNLKRNSIRSKRNNQINGYTKRTYNKKDSQVRRTKYRAVK